MVTTLTSKGQVTIPKHIRDAMHLEPGSQIEFALNAAREIVIIPAPKKTRRKKVDCFEAAHGTATVKWSTNDLMKLLRDDAS